MPGLGVDLHPYYQRGVTALPGVEYGWLKLADGTRRYTYRDNAGKVWTPDAHAALFRGLRIPFGGYVYAQPGDGGTEAQVLWNECLRLGATGVAPACDIESNTKIHTWSTAEARDHGRAFCSALRKIGVRPAIYMSDSLAGATQPDTWPEDPVLWIARYGSKPTRTRYDVHQYSSSGTLPGSAGAVDWNQSYTTAHLIAGGTIVAFTQEDFNNLMWSYRFDDDGQGHTGNFAQAIKSIRDTVNATAAAVAKGSSASAPDIAAALLPGLLAGLKADGVANLDEDAIATKVVDLFHERTAS